MASSALHRITFNLNIDDLPRKDPPFHILPRRVPGPYIAPVARVQLLLDGKVRAGHAELNTPHLFIIKDQEGLVPLWTKGAHTKGEVLQKSDGKVIDWHVPPALWSAFGVVAWPAQAELVVSFSRGEYLAQLDLLHTELVHAERIRGVPVALSRADAGTHRSVAEQIAAYRRRLGKQPH